MGGVRVGLVGYPPSRIGCHDLVSDRFGDRCYRFRRSSRIWGLRFWFRTVRCGGQKLGTPSNRTAGENDHSSHGLREIKVAESGTSRSVFLFMYADRVLTCSDCGQEFTFTASEQEFYADRGFSEPRRCSSCRATRKAQRNGGAGAGAGAPSSGGSRSGGYTGGGYTGGSGGYSSGGGGGYSSGGGGGYSSGGGGGYGGGSRSSGGSYGDRPQREMFDAVCSECGKTAKVPFRPTSGKPVYCTDCFARRRA